MSDGPKDYELTSAVCFGLDRHRQRPKISDSQKALLVNEKGKAPNSIIWLGNVVQTMKTPMREVRLLLECWARPKSLYAFYI